VLFSPTQYSNPHTQKPISWTTGPEIWASKPQAASPHLIASIGTGGTISGIGRY